MTRALLIVLACAMLSGCCRFCKPAVAPPIELVQIRRVCLSRLPPLLPAVARTDEGCPADHACYGPADSTTLGHWILEIAEWSRDAVTLCGVYEKGDEDDETTELD